VVYNKCYVHATSHSNKALKNSTSNAEKSTSKVSIIVTVWTLATVSTQIDYYCIRYDAE